MSNFACEHCGVVQVDSPRGYMEGCHHHPPEDQRITVLDYGAGEFTDIGFYHRPHGAWYRSLESMHQFISVHPVRWIDYHWFHQNNPGAIAQEYAQSNFESQSGRDAKCYSAAV